MTDQALAWRIEDACMMAWPALREERIPGWVLRFSEGLTRRANSANPLHGGIGDPDGVISACEGRYRAHGLPTFFRIPSILDSAMDQRLEGRGYSVEGKSAVMHADLRRVPSQSDAAAELAAAPGAEWLGAMSLLQRHTEKKSATYAKIVTSIANPAAFVGARNDGRLAALAYGAMHDGLLCIESVITDVGVRRRGHARRMLSSLIEWARTAGAEGVCLQVEAGNEPAISLYRSLGLRELYRYHYRREPLPA